MMFFPCDFFSGQQIFMVYFLIPVYNEEGNIKSLLSNLNSTMERLGEKSDFIFVNDGSSDGTADTLKKASREHPITILLNEPNQGVGISFDKGFKHIVGIAKQNDIIVTMEGDNTADLTTLPKLIASVRNGKDFALASVYTKGGKIVGTTPIRLLLSYTANILCKLVFRIWAVNTFSSFYRAHSLQAIKSLYQKHNGRVITEKGYICMVEMLLKLYHSGYQFDEIPTVLQSDKRVGTSKLKKLRTIAAYLRLFIKYPFSRFSS